MTARKARRSLLDPASSRWDREVTLSYGQPPEEHTHTHFNRDDVRGQLRSLHLLEQLLKRSEAEDLPAMTWTVTPHAVSGEITATGSCTPERCREAFMAWTDALGAKWREHKSASTGRVELRGAAVVPALGASRLEASVGLAAIWWADEDQAGGK